MIASARRAAPFAAIVLVAATHAAAQQPARSPNDVAYDEARKRFDEGKRLIREGTREGNAAKLEMAYVEFKEAYALYPHAKASLLNLVESEILTGRQVDAMKRLREFVREHGTPDERSEYAKAFRQHWDNAFKATGHIDIDAPPGVRVLVDNEEVGFAPLATVDVSPGHHTIEGSGPQSLRAETNAPAGTIVRASLEPPPAAPPASSTAVSTSFAPSVLDSDGKVGRRGGGSRACCARRGRRLRRPQQKRRRARRHAQRAAGSDGLQRHGGDDVSGSAIGAR
jgi:hypothetical protein